ncbi:uncharacterized protein [Nicotiana tomentosiformis]|uniref:uncharacterized protein n=1 Tax=Nicotiana tomentosiformis TaxID=4098 RepID=UPI00388C966D
MDDLSGIRKDNAENVETSDGRNIPAQNELVLHVELLEGYKPPKFEMFDGTSDPKVHLRTYYDKLVEVGKDERIRMKLFMRSLTGDTLSWYISQNPKKWVNWVSMASDYMDLFKLNTKNIPDIFYIQNLKKKPTKTFCEYNTRWRSEAAKVRPALEEEQAKEVAPTVHNNPLLNHRGERVILTPIVVQTEAPIEVEVAAPTSFEAEVATPFTVIVAPTPSFKSNAITWDYVAETRRKGKAKIEETGAAQVMTRTGRAYTPEHLGGISKEAASKPPVIETGPDDLWRKVQAREYSVVDHLNKTPAQISILSLLQNSEAHRNALMKVLNEVYVPNNITSGEMANMVGQVLESHNSTFHEDELPPEGLSHNMALHITVQFEDKFIAMVLIDGGSSLNTYPLTTLKRLGKDLYEIRAESMHVKEFDGSQRSTIGETNLSLQMGLTWFNVEFQVLDISATYNLLLGQLWIHAVGAVASTLH